MESSGNNRYELLFMDDEGNAPPPTEIGVTKKKPASVSAIGAVTSKKPSSGSNKKGTISTGEKENKSAALNKVDVGKKYDAVKGTGSAGLQVGQLKNKLKPNDGSRKIVEQRQQTSTIGEVVRERRNFGGVVSTGEYGTERQPRQYKDRPRNRNGERLGKREFDRQSGSDKTGVKAVDKRDGAGAHNWGSVKQDIEDINKAGVGELPLTDKEESANEQSGDPIPVPEEEETKEMTLDEWKAMKEQRAKPEYNLRKAGEGVDNSQWKKMVVLNKKKEDDSEEELEYDPSMYPQRVGRLQRIVDIEFNFNDGRRGGFRGRGRARIARPAGAAPGGERSDRDRGERADRADRNDRIDRTDRGERNGRSEGGNGGGGPVAKTRNFGERQRGGNSNNLKVDDERQFPTLS